MKKLIKKFTNFFKFSASIFLIVLIIALHLIFFYYIKANFENPDSRYFRILLGAVGFTGTIAGLSLRLSSCSPDGKLRNKFYSIGKRLTFCVILFVVAIGLQYTHSLLGIPDDVITIPKPMAASIERAEKISVLVKKGLYFIGIPSFIYGLFISLLSLGKLTWLMTKSTEKTPCA